MENKTIDEVEDNSIGAVLHQGKTIAQWEKILKKDLNLTQEQILKLVRAGVDLDRMLLGLDETEDDEVNEDAFNDPVFKGEKFFFNEDEELDEASIKDYIMPTLDYKVLDAATGDEIWETRIDPSDAKWIVPYIGEFIYGKQSVLMLNDRKLLDKLVPGQKLKCMLFVDGKPCAMDKNVLKHQIMAIEQRVARVAANTYKFKDNEKIAIDESIGNDPEDVVTVEDFMKLLRAKADLDDKVMFRLDKQEIALFDINTKAGITVVDFIDNKRSDRLNEDDDSSNVNETEIVLDQFYDHECLSVKDFKSLGQTAFPHNSSAWESMTVAGIINGKVIEFPKAYFVKLDHGPDAGTVFLLDGTDASQQTYDKDLSMLFKEEKSIEEGRSWRDGGYGGTGRAYSSLGSKAPRGEEIGWYKVSDLDPKAAGKMPGWRCGPSNFPFNDALYGIGTGRLDPDGKSRKYKVGTMIMRNKHVNAGSASGIVDIAVPSYFAAIKSNDEDAIAMLKLLGIPLDLTFGMDPNDDYSVTYTAIG